MDSRGEQPRIGVRFDGEWTYRRVIALALVVTLAALLLPVGVVGNARFRVPMEPFLAILAGAGVVRPYASARPGPATASPTVANSAHKQT